MVSVVGEDTQIDKWYLDTAAISASESVSLAAGGRDLLFHVDLGKAA